MKLLHYIPSLDRAWGGTTSYMQLLSKELGKLVELHVVSHHSVNQVILENASIHYIEQSLWKLNLAKKQWLDLLNKIRPDVVHVNCCWMPLCAYTQQWSQEAGYKVVLTPHGMLEPYIMHRHYWTKKLPALLLYQKRAIRNADMIHATALCEKDNILRLGYNDKIEVIPNGIDVNSIQLRTNWERRKQILFLSRIHPKKGIEFLIEAVWALKGVFKDYRIVIAGEGETHYVKQLRKEILSMGLNDIIVLLGGVYGERKWQLYRDSDLFVLPTYSENFGIVIAEALATGTPVITTTGTPWEELNTKHCGWWIEIGRNPLIEALNQYISLTEGNLKEMGKNGRKLIEQKYSAKIMAESLAKLYRNMIIRMLSIDNYGKHL